MFSIEQAMKVESGSRGRVFSFFSLGAGWGSVVNAAHRPLYPRDTDPVLILQYVGGAPGPVWTDAENLASTGFGLRTVQLVASRYTD